MIITFDPKVLYEIQKEFPEFDPLSTDNIKQAIKDCEIKLVTQILTQLYKRPLTNLDYLNCERIYDHRYRYTYKLIVERVFVGTVYNHAFDLSKTISEILMSNSTPVIFEFIPSENFK